MADSEGVGSRYARHFSLREVGPKGQQKLSEAAVLLVGAGGLGSPIALYLAAAGVGKIGLVDADLVSLSNLQRQILFSEQDLGKSKVLTASEKLKNLNSEIEIQVHNFELDSSNARELVRNYDLVIDGSDNFKTRYTVNDACVLENKTLIFGALYKFEAQISVLHFEDGPCYRCLYPEPPPAEAIPNCAESGVLGVLPGMAGTMMAAEALKIILGIGKPLKGELLYIDVLTNSFLKRKVARNKSCIVCGESPVLTELQSVTAAVHGLSWLEFEALPHPQFLVDVRNPDEISAAPIIGAKIIPLPELKSRMDEIPTDQNTVFVCQSGKRSARAVEIFESVGRKSQHIEGGLLGR